MSDFPSLNAAVHGGPDVVARNVRWCSDPGHGWLLVPMAWAISADMYLAGRRLCGRMTYTAYSCVDVPNGCAWLEEDIDAPRFLVAVCELLDLSAGARPDELQGLRDSPSHELLRGLIPETMVLDDDAEAFRRFWDGLPAVLTAWSGSRWELNGNASQDVHRSAGRWGVGIEVSA